MKRIPSLDGFRALSIIFVLISHAARSTGFPKGLVDIAAQGKEGVTVFFVISGFLITNLLLTEELKTGNISLGAFYLRRAIRILPVFLLYTLFIILWRNVENYGTTNANIAHVFTFTVNFDKNKDWFLGHFWTLSVEEQFYLFWPFTFIFFRKHLKPVLIIMIVYCCICRIISYKFPAYGNILLAPFFVNADAILVGVLASIWYFENPGVLKNKLFSSYWLQGLALITIISFIYFAANGKLSFIQLPFGHLVISLAVMFLILCYIKPSDNWTYALLNSRVMVHIGVLSYSIYVWQEFFFLGTPAFNFLRTLPLNILLIYITALASYYLWESRFLRLKKYIHN